MDLDKLVKDCDPKKHFLDKMGRLKTQCLFYEYKREDIEPLYTLKPFNFEVDGKTYPSLKLLYLATRDPLEYAFAETYLYSWEHWQRLCDNAILAAHISEWRNELDIKIRADALRSIAQVAVSPDPKSIPAAKFLVQKGWVDKKDLNTEEEEYQKSSMKKQLTADLARLNLKTVK